MPDDHRSQEVGAPASLDPLTAHSDGAAAPLVRRYASLLFASCLFAASLCLNLQLIGKWSFSGDEIYTLFDSQMELREIISCSSKPIYYLICHLTLQLPVAPEFAMRLPAAIAGAMIGPVYYLMLWRPFGPRAAVYASILVAVNPWLFEFAQFARFYTLTFLFVSVAVLSMYRWLWSRRTAWLLLFCVTGLLALLTHNGALTTVAATVAAGAVVLAMQDWTKWLRVIKTRWPLLAAGATIFSVAAVLLNYETFMTWYHSPPGRMGDYSETTLLAGWIIRTGLQVWAIGMISLLKPPQQWTRTEVFFALSVVGSAVPFFLLARLGGGVAVRYLLAATPGLFVLAAIQWARLADCVPSTPLRLGLGVALLTPHIPHLASQLADGSHYDFRQAVDFVESLRLDDPLIASFSHGIFMHYAARNQLAAHPEIILPMHRMAPDEQGISCHHRYPIPDLSAVELETIVSASANSSTVEAADSPEAGIERLIAEANLTGKVLILVSEEDPSTFDRQTSDWLGDRFTVMKTIGKRRYDHRQFRLVVYRYRPELGHENGRQSSDGK